MSTHLLVIDPQNDFCDLPADWCPLDPVTQSPHGPALPVPGAHRDLLRLSEWMQRQCRRIDGITVTLDSHQQLDIAHPGFWMTAGGDDVRPFQVVTVDDLQQKRIQPRDSSLSEEVQAYVEALESQGRYQLMIWPVHCQIGTWGHNLHDAVWRLPITGSGNKNVRFSLCSREPTD